MRKIYELVRPYGLHLAWTSALVAMLGSLFFSEVQGWAPCVLCWYQRIAMYPLVLVLGAGIIREDSNVKYYSLPLATIGALTALYHYLLQMGVIAEKLAPCAEGVSCVTRHEIVFNFVTIPLLSFLSFVAVIVGVLIYKKGN